jgi:lysophospholipase
VLLGTAEEVVSSSVIRAQVAKMAAGELVLIDGARHEIFMEAPPVQAEVWQRIDGFLDALRARPGTATAASA